MNGIASFLKPHWRTALGLIVGAGGGAAYAHFIGCHTGTCLITSNVWTAAAFFGFTGAVVGMPGPRREEPKAREHATSPRSP